MADATDAIFVHVWQRLQKVSSTNAVPYHLRNAGPIGMSSFDAIGIPGPIGTFTIYIITRAQDDVTAFDELDALPFFLGVFRRETGDAFRLERRGGMKDHDRRISARELFWSEQIGVGENSIFNL